MLELGRRRQAARRSCASRSSAIWIALRAAPLRRLSATTNSTSPFRCRRVGADPPDEHVVAARRTERGGELLEPDPRRGAEDRGRLLGRERLLGLEPVFSPHDLRHRRISLLHRQGRSWAEIAGFVGQRKLSITADTYSHVMSDGQELDYGMAFR